MRYKFYCITCGNKVIGIFNAEVGDTIDSTLAPEFKEHVGHDCKYYPMVK